MTVRRLVQISTGLGAGNIGDEFMARAFWDHLPPGIRLEVEMFPEYGQQRDPYPQAHRYFLTDWEAAGTVPPGLPGLLVGGTPVAEWQGLHFPLEYVGRRLARFNCHGLAVDAVGVGVDRLEQPQAREIFARWFAPIRSWTVRTERCRQALLDLGVAEDRILVGADWAWLYRPRRDLRDWGAGVWRGLGVDPSQPLVVVNTVNEKWAGLEDRKTNLAQGLDRLAAEHGFQLAFFCNEMREGPYFDRAAAEAVRTRMTSRAALVPNLYYGPDETLGLLAHADVTLCERYHFTVESVLAGAAPVCIVRGQKMAGLVEELGLEAAGAVEGFTAEALAAAVAAAWGGRKVLRERLGAARKEMENRAARNLSLFRRLEGI
jgi:polysaccharide pyruvyl transferase WcaK-like protein